MHDPLDVIGHHAMSGPMVEYNMISLSSQAICQSIEFLILEFLKWKFSSSIIFSGKTIGRFPCELCISKTNDGTVLGDPREVSHTNTGIPVEP